MSHIFIKTKSLSSAEKFFWFPAFAWFLIQLAGVVYLNLFQMPYFTGFDASAYYVLAHEMVEQNTIMVDHFVYNTTTMLWDSPLLLAAFFHLFIQDIFICYGLSNTFSALFLVFTLVLFGDCLELGWKAKLTSLILLFTPYVSNYYTYNDLGYISMLFISMGAYAWRLPCILWIYILFLEWDTWGITKQNRWKFPLGMGFLVLNSISSGSFILVFGIAPLLVFILIRGIVEDKWWNVHHNSNIFVCILILTSILCQVFTRYVLKFEYLDTSSSWISLHDFFDNLQNMFLGFLELLGALPLHRQISVFQLGGILYGMRLFLAVSLIMAVCYELKKDFKKNTACQLVSCFILSHILIFTLLDTKYGASIFEIRYIIFVAVMMFCVFARFIQRVSTCENRTFRYFCAITLSISLISIQISSYDILRNEKTDYDIMKEVTNYLGGFEDSLVYFSGESEYFPILAANMRAVDFSKVYKFSSDLKSIYHCGDYDYYDENADYDGGTFLITVPWMFHDLDVVFRESYDLIHSFPDNEIYIYYSDDNPVDLAGGFGKTGFGRDFPYSASVICDENMGNHLENGRFQSNGLPGVLCSSSFPVTEGGFADFTMYYEILNGTGGTFDILLGDELIGSTPISLTERYVQVSGIDLRGREKEILTYRVVLKDGTELELISFELELRN